MVFAIHQRESATGIHVYPISSVLMYFMLRILNF